MLQHKLLLLIVICYTQAFVSHVRQHGHQRGYPNCYSCIDKKLRIHKESTDTGRSKKRFSKLRKKRGKNKSASSFSLEPETWRIYGVTVHPDILAADEEEISPYLSQPVLSSLWSRLKISEIDGLNVDEKNNSPLKLPSNILDVRLVRRSLDARKKKLQSVRENRGPMYTYVLDVVISSGLEAQRNLRLKHQPGRMERLDDKNRTNEKQLSGESPMKEGDKQTEKRKVVIVGAGPAGLFCALILAQTGLITPILLERGQPVESRGKDIGALIHRRSLNEESNFAFGEGGAGTWSDGKLTTRIGRNSGAVRFVLETMVKYGAPERILVDGAPHLGTDNLVRLLRNMRKDIRDLGGEIRFGAKVTEFIHHDGVCTGVHVEYSQAIERGSTVPPQNHHEKGAENITGDAVVLATGHSARDVYESLHEAGVKLEAKGFAAGFRVEHPQSLITKIQYGQEWGRRVITGKSVTDNTNRDYFTAESDSDNNNNTIQHHAGRLPVPSYRLATDKAFDGSENRGVYSFCMCPGGQIVLSSTSPDGICVNGMSFSKRDSVWANSALVVTVSPDDEVLKKYKAKHGVLAGIEFQKDMERKAAIMGGGNLTVPVQRLTDFVRARTSATVPSSSYRLGVKSAPCHELYPEQMTRALKDAVVNHFDKSMPGFLSDDALLHAVETRTSSPVRVTRDAETMQTQGSISGIFPAGEGAGYAGGIVSAAVDGMVVADAVLGEICDTQDMKSLQKWKGKGAASVGFGY